ncbi:MAG: sulfatase-like hydrolase/transferase, partial [Planctomycetaceae bacterium]|nr:sulfatase-like hydrolase/transferase [Planctomycetaceae bacterium]
MPLLRILIGALTACQIVSAAEADDRPRRPNIVILLADDLGYGELGCQGNGEVPTPSIDSIAEAGVRCTDGYVTAPFCSASRAGLLTGRYQTRFGYEFNPIGAQNTDPQIGLPVDVPTLAEQLHEVGYATGLVGKWHLGGTAAYHPQRRGFDEFFGFLHEGHYFVPPPYADVTTWLRRRRLPDGGEGRWTSSDGRLVLSTHLRHDEPPYDADNPILRGSQPVNETSYLTDALTREAVDFITRHRERPFLLYVAYNAVHSPMQAPQAEMERFSQIEDVQRRIFAGMLARLDDSVGRILATLREEGLEEDTLVWFLSDNGGPTAELTSSNSPLRGGKGQLYEGGIRIPFLIRWLGTLPAGAVESRPVSSLDIYATSAAAAGREAGQITGDGVDLMPMLTGGSLGAPRESLYWRVGERAALRNGDWKIVRHPVRGQGPRWELYNLASDDSESHDLAAAEPQRL